MSLCSLVTRICQRESTHMCPDVLICCACVRTVYGICIHSFRLVHNHRHIHCSGRGEMEHGT